MRKRLLLGLVLFCALCATAEASRTIRTESCRDALGFEFPLGLRPERIISLSPNLTEILFAIGVERRRIVGVTRFCNYPPEVDGIARVGGIVDPSVEVILSLRPDLVVATRGNPSALLGRLRAAGLAVFAFESQGGLDLLLETMETMAQIVGAGAGGPADSVLARLRSRRDCLRAVSATIPDHARQAIYYYDPVSPDWTAGPGTHITEAISLAGGCNVAENAPVAWPRYALESLVVRQPDVILVANGGAGDGDTAPGMADEAAAALLADLRNRPGWRGLDAVRDSSICVVPADWLMRPGPRVLDAVELLGRCLHPERSWECPR